jgi:hypothetical protein
LPPTLEQDLTFLLNHLSPNIVKSLLDLLAKGFSSIFSSDKKPFRLFILRWGTLEIDYCSIPPATEARSGFSVMVKHADRGTPTIVALGTGEVQGDAAGGDHCAAADPKALVRP